MFLKSRFGLAGIILIATGAQGSPLSLPSSSLIRSQTFELSGNCTDGTDVLLSAPAGLTTPSSVPCHEGQFRFAARADKNGKYDLVAKQETANGLLSATQNYHVLELKRVASIPLAGAFVNFVRVYGDYLFVSNRIKRAWPKNPGERFDVWNISDPKAPRKVFSLSNEDENISTLIPAGRYLYKIAQVPKVSSSNEAKLTVHDLENSGQIVNEMPFGDACAGGHCQVLKFPESILVDGNVLTVFLDWMFGIETVDTSDPLRPDFSPSTTFQGSVGIPHGLRGIGDLAFTTWGLSPNEILISRRDTANRRRYLPVATLPCNGDPKSPLYGTRFDGNTFFAVTHDGILPFDISEPANPKSLHFRKLKNSTSFGYAHGLYFHTPHYEAGLRYDVFRDGTDPLASPEPLANVGTKTNYIGFTPIKGHIIAVGERATYHNLDIDFYALE